MAQLPGAGLGKAQVKAIRLTALNGDCTYGATPKQCTILNCVSNISTDVQIEEGQRIAPKSANSSDCWVIEAGNNLQYITFPTFSILTWELEALGIMASDVSLYNLGVIAVPNAANSGTTFGLGRTLGLQASKKFALEIYSTIGADASAGGCVTTVAGNELTWYELYANVQKGYLTAATTRDETTPHVMGISGARGYANPSWGTGPSNSMPGGATLGVKHGEFMAYNVDVNGLPRALPVAGCVN